MGGRGTASVYTNTFSRIQQHTTLSLYHSLTHFLKVLTVVTVTNKPNTIIMVISLWLDLLRSLSLVSVVRPSIL